MRVISVLTLIWLLGGCATTSELGPPTIPDDPYYAPLEPEQPAELVASTGSLFQGRRSSGLYTDFKARMVGDIITVRLQESTQASKNAKTEYDRSQAYNLNPITGLGGNPVNIGGDSIQLGVDSSNEYDGESKADQSNSLSGNISVSVIKVYPNGNLLIRGEKWMALNTGQEFLRLTGIIRQQDVDAENTVISTKIANARIEYSGTGAFQTGQQPGWLSKFFASVAWPF